MYTMYMKYDANTEAPLPIHEARRNLAELINRVAYAGERIRLGRRGRTVAVIVSVEDTELLQALEDRMDLAAARKALRESRGKRLIPLKEIKARLGM